MVKIVFTPDWFLNFDILIELFSFIVPLLFFIFAFKCYRIGKKKGMFYLGIGFFLIAIAELAAILTKLVLYYDIGVTQEIGRAIITYEVAQSVDFFYHIGFFFERFFTLLGLYVIYKIPYKKFSVDSFLTAYLILVAALLSSSLYYFYHLTAIILLVLIIGNYYKIYKKDKVPNTKILIGAFALLLVSQTIFLLSKLSSLYVIAQTIQLVSYITLLIIIIKIMKDGKKKKSNGYNP